MRQTPILIVPATLVLLLAGCVTPDPVSPEADAAPPAPSPYADQMDTTVRGLTPEEVADLRAGAGLGLARPAELNGYPGPRHVLDLADELELTPAQRERMTRLFEDMQAEAQALGEDIVRTYHELEGAFRNGTITEARLQVLVGELDALYRELRLVHLGTHLETPGLLTHEQIARYHELRGYGEMEGHGGHGGHPAHGH